MLPDLARERGLHLVGAVNLDAIADDGDGTAGQAIALAAAATPVALENEPFQDDHGIPLGSRVTVTAESFGPEPTEGELMAATRTHYTLRRNDERAGTVHVHFPRIGFALRAVAPA